MGLLEQWEAAKKKGRGLLNAVDDGLLNLSVGLGHGIENQLEGTYQMARHPVQTAQGLLAMGKQVAQDPSVIGGLLADTYKRGSSGLLGFGEVLGENLSPGMFRGRVPNRNELITYHGSPHRINNVTPDAPYGRFDMSKIGTGEGAQAYGHGVYLAESPDVAKSYASLGHVKGNVATIGGKPITDVYDQLNNQAARLPIAQAQGNYDRMALLENLMNNQTPSDVLQYAKANDYSADAIKWFEREVVPKYEGSGHFYTVDLPDEHIAKMLDWDAPLSQQPEAVQRAMQSALGPDLWQRFSQDPNLNRTGGFGYSFIANQLGDKQKATEVLRAAGIPGIKYLDGGSRSAGEGTRNFVIFDGDTAKILKRE